MENPKEVEEVDVLDVKEIHTETLLKLQDAALVKMTKVAKDSYFRILTLDIIISLIFLMFIITGGPSFITVGCLAYWLYLVADDGRTWWTFRKHLKFIKDHEEESN